MGDLDDARGILYPAALPKFQRREVPVELGYLARWYWISDWTLIPGVVSRQAMLPFPAANLVVQPAGVTVSGATTGVSTRELTGRSWAFGVLLRPAGLDRLGIAAERIVDSEQPLVAEKLMETVAPRMDVGDVAGAALAMSHWWRRLSDSGCEAVPEGAVQADRLIGIVEADPGVVDVDGLASGLGLSTRAVQRLAKQYIGLSPLRIIRRYRLQEAARRLRENPDLTVARVATELGYSDQSHLAADFRSTLGLSPRDYRRQRQP